MEVPQAFPNATRTFDPWNRRSLGFFSEAFEDVAPNEQMRLHMSSKALSVRAYDLNLARRMSTLLNACKRSVRTGRVYSS